MCIVLLAHRVHDRYPLIVAANRDEFYERPSAQAHYWEDAPDVLAGRDIKAGGTWMGVSQDGRWGVVTNIRRPGHDQTGAPSRGNLVASYLSGSEDPRSFLRHLAERTGASYNGFNLILGDGAALWHFNSESNRIAEVAPGVHGLSNATLNTPWPKVRSGTERLKRLAESDVDDSEPLFRLLQDRTQAPDSLLPDTGIGREWERNLSPLFIESPDYGTRTSTVLLGDRYGVFRFEERTFHRGWSSEPDIVRFEFRDDVPRRTDQAGGGTGGHQERGH